MDERPLKAFAPLSDNDGQASKGLRCIVR